MLAGDAGYPTGGGLERLAHISVLSFIEVMMLPKADLPELLRTVTRALEARNEDNGPAAPDRVRDGWRPASSFPASNSRAGSILMLRAAAADWYPGRDDCRHKADFN